MSRGKYGKLYAIRSRVREQSEITIHGGTKIGSHRRRVSRWSKWQLRAYERHPLDAIRRRDLVAKQLGLAEVAVFFDGKRMTVDELRAKANAEKIASTGYDLDGQPVDANGATP